MPPTLPFSLDLICIVAYAASPSPFLCVTFILGQYKYISGNLESLKVLCAPSEQAGLVWCAQSCHPAACKQKSLLIWDLVFASTAAHPFCLGCSLPVSSSAAAVANTGLMSLGTRQRIKANIPRNSLWRSFLERQHMTLLTDFKCEQCWGFRSAGRIHLGGDGSSFHHPRVTGGSSICVSSAHKQGVLSELFLSFWLCQGLHPVSDGG